MYRNLREFIEKLEAAGELARITVPVDPVLEIAEITDRISKSEGGGKALFFENTGTVFPVITNMFGSRKRMAMALGYGSLDEVSSRIDALVSRVLSPKNNFSDKLAMLPLLGNVSRWLPRQLSGRGECQQVVMKGGEAMLSKLPILKCWPYDGGRFITLPLVHTTDPLTGTRNVGMYRMQVRDEATTGMHWHIHKTGERHYREYKKLGRKMPVSVCLGGDPAYTYSATAPLPDNIDEYLLAGFLRNKPVKLVRCLTNELYVPSDCDFVIEGYVDPMQEKFMEGPFGDHTGFYSLEDLYPEFHVTAITHRHDAIYPATVVGIPPQEDAWLAEATEKIFLSPIRAALQPEIEDLYMPSAGTAHNLAIVSIDKTYPGQALKVASSMWGAGQMMFNKFMFVTPAGTDIRNPSSLAELIRSVDIGKDVVISKGVLDILDHATATPGEGGKMALDLTAGRARQETNVPEDILLSPWIYRIDDRWLDDWSVFVIYCDPAATPDIGRFLADNSLEGVNFIVISDTATYGLDGADLLWFCSAQSDPARDVLIHDGIMVIDARSKYPYRQSYPKRVPNIVVSSPQTIMTVDLRWDDYGLGPEITSPSEKFGHLDYGGGAEIKKT